MKKEKTKPNWAASDTTAENEVLPRWFKWLWSARGVAFSLNMVLMLQITYFCTDLLGMPAMLVGTLLMASKIVDACTDLFAGFIIDRTRTKYGKARPYDIFVGIMWLMTVLLFTVPDFGLVGKSVYIFIMYVLANSICSTFVMAADPVYMSRAVRSDKNKVSVTSFQGAMIMIIATVVSILLPPLIKNVGAQKSGWTLIALLFAVPLTIIGSIRMFVIREMAAEGHEDASTAKNLSIKDGVRSLIKNNMALIVCGLALLYNAINAVATATATYYFKWIFGDIGMASLVSLPAMLTPLVLIFVPVLSRKFGTGKLMRFGMVCATAGYAIRLIGGANIATILFGSVLAQMGVIPIGTLLSIYEMECMDYGEWKTGIRVEGMITSVTGFFVKVGSAIGSGLLGVLMGLSGYVSSEAATSQSDAAIGMIKFLFNGLPMILSIGTIILALFYTIDKVRPQMIEDLAKKRQA